MPKRGHSEEQIVEALTSQEGGESTKEICRRMGISTATFYSWKKQCAGVGVSELRELRQLWEENGKLKRLVADLALDRHILQKAVAKELSNASPLAALDPARLRLANFFRVLVRTVKPSSLYTRYTRLAFTLNPSRFNNTIKRW